MKNFVKSLIAFIKNTYGNKWFIRGVCALIIANIILKFSEYDFLDAVYPLPEILMVVCNVGAMICFFFDCKETPWNETLNSDWMNQPFMTGITTVWMLLHLAICVYFFWCVAAG
ncbi:MAG: hypothetical protein LUE23_11535 [Lachnospiraceae bacterium]|nr:hypothetical protein [Lachnospiraceae bacterium]